MTGPDRASWSALPPVPFVEDEPQDRGPDAPCWCPDSFRANGLSVTYCPRHGRKPDPELT